MKYKKRIIIVLIFAIVLTVTSYYFIFNKPQTSKFTKAKLVFESITNNELWE